MKRMKVMEKYREICTIKKEVFLEQSNIIINIV